MTQGRPSDYSDEIADQICDMLIDGKSFVQIAETEGMPSRSTIHRWQASNDEFATKCARARELQADYMDHKILKTADECTVDTAQADRVKISAYQWRAEKLNPKRYGQKVQAEHSGPDGGAIQTSVTVIERRIVKPGN